MSVIFHFSNSALSIYIQLSNHGPFFFSFIPATLLLVSIQLNSHESLFSIPTTLPLVYIQLSNLASFFVLISTTLLLVSIQSNNHESFFLHSNNSALNSIYSVKQPWVFYFSNSNDSSLSIYSQSSNHESFFPIPTTLPLVSIQISSHGSFISSSNDFALSIYPVKQP